MPIRLGQLIKTWATISSTVAPPGVASVRIASTDAPKRSSQSRRTGALGPQGGGFWIGERKPPLKVQHWPEAALFNDIFILPMDIILTLYRSRQRIPKDLK